MYVEHVSDMRLFLRFFCALQILPDWMYANQIQNMSKIYQNMLNDVQKIISCCGFCGTFYREEEERTMYILLFLLWVALNGKLTAEIAVFGVFIAGGAYWFMCKNLEYDPKNDIRMVKNSFRAIVYIIVLFTEIVKSSIAVMKIVFSKSVDIQPQMVFFEVPLKSEFLLTVLANPITLTPGTITVDVKDNHFCVHALDYTLAQGFEDSVFVRLLMKMEDKEDDKSAV